MIKINAFTEAIGLEAAGFNYFSLLFFSYSQQGEHLKSQTERSICWCVGVA